MSTEFSDLFELGVSERLQLVEDLWDSIASVPDWQKEELAKRKAAHQQNPDAAVTWEEAKKRIRDRNG